MELERGPHDKFEILPLTTREPTSLVFEELLFARELAVQKIERIIDCSYERIVENN